MLFTIWSDEAGNGRVEQNHSNIYRDLLNSLSLYMPEVTARAFVEQQDLLDEAFEAPVFALAISQYPSTHFAHLLGMTLWLEWEATPSMLPLVAILEGHGINAHFFRLHATIDNVSSGHGALARKVIEMFLDEVRLAGGDSAVQEQWQQVWTGYVAFATVGNLGESLAQSHQRWLERPQAEQRMLQLVRSKAWAARTSHGDRTLTDPQGKAHSLNALFADPEALLQALVSSGQVIPGNPRESRLLTMNEWGGRMFRIFSPEEVAIISDWILSLATPAPASPPLPEAGLADGLDPGQAMADLIRRKSQAVGRAHGQLKLTHPDGRERLLDDWFDDPPGLMQALLCSGLLDTRNVVQSPLLQAIDRIPAMRNQFSAEDRQVLRAWIEAGAPRPQADDQDLPASLCTEPLRRVQQPRARRRRIWGMGACH